jgi:hypothetical protein
LARIVGSACGVFVRRSGGSYHAGIESDRAAPPGRRSGGSGEYGLSIEIVLLIAALAIAVFVALALPPRARRNGDASEAETRDAALSDDRGGRFKRWRRLR